MIRKSLSTAILGIALLASVSLAKDDSKAFLKMAASNGSAEVQQAKLALTMASNPDIQAFSKKLIADHDSAHGKIMTLAKTGKVMLATEPTAKQKAELERLSKLSDRNRDFDREYLAATVKNHEKSIKAYEKQAKMGTDADVRAFAKQTLPVLKAHRDEAAVISTRLNLKSNE